MLQGLIGYGLYYLELSKKNPSKRACVEHIVHLLINMAEQTDGCIYWSCTSETHCSTQPGEQWINMGFLHGMPSVIAFLLVCLRERIYVHGLKVYAIAGLDSIMTLEHNAVRNGKWHNSLIVRNGHFVPAPPFADFPYYCNGPLGTFNTIIEAASVLDSKKYSDAAAEMLPLVARMLFDSRRYSCSCMCHGRAGQLYFIHKLKRLLGEGRCLSVERSAVETILSNLERSNEEPGLLTGYNGIILSLLFALDGDVSFFEHSLLLK